MSEPTFPAGLDSNLARLWYGSAVNDGQVHRFDEDDPVSRLWLKLGRFPRLEWAEDFGQRMYFRFGDGTVIWRSSPDADYRVLQLPHRTLEANPGGGPKLPEGMDRDLAALWYGTAANDGQVHRFDEDDPVSRLWLVLGRFPRLEWTEDFGQRMYFRFADGTVIWRPDGQSPYRVLGGANPNGPLFPEGMDRDLAALWFGTAANDGRVHRFDEADPVCRLWLVPGRYPRLQWVEDFGQRLYCRFADGTVMWRPDEASSFRVLGGVQRSLSAIWGGGERPFTQEFCNETGPDFYRYGLEYCLNGREHTGIDVDLEYEDTLFAPVAGTITCAGTGLGGGTHGQGCAAFPDTGDECPGPSIGAGRIELQIDNDTTLIFGHSRVCFHDVGTQVSAGQPIGTVGGMCGPHTHIEMRVRDAGCGSGWRIVDPRDVLGQ